MEKQEDLFGSCSFMRGAFFNLERCIQADLPKSLAAVGVLNIKVCGLVHLDINGGGVKLQTHN